MDKPAPPSDRTRLRRLHERGRYDLETIYSIVDSTPLCHVGYIGQDGAPAVIPTFHWRKGNRVYWHGSSASRMIRGAESAQVCLTFTQLDGLVLARSAFHHSANYRSVMAFGVAEKVADDAKEDHMQDFIEHLWPGRWAELRPVNAQELKATTILGLELNEASAKTRTGGPKDDEEDYALSIWAGVQPIEMTVGQTIPDERNLPGVAVPEHVLAFKLDKSGPRD